VTVEASIAAVATLTGDIGAKLTFGNQRPWEEKWQLARDYRDAIAALYVGRSNLSSRERQALVTAFFVECDHLRDWLDGDIASLPGVTSNDIYSHFKGSQPLQHCNEICNTHKHYSRIRKDGTVAGPTARVREFTANPDGSTQVTIGLEWATPAETPIDALKLADQCLDSWRAFFKTHGIKEPD
jgi:hypothetical protein